jgi:hypothetical protein
MFPKHDLIEPGGFGNAIRGPLGIHRGATWRFLVLGRRLWVEAQIAYLNGLRKFTEHELQAFIAGKDGPNQDNAPRSKISGSTYRLAGPVDQSSAYWSMSGPFVGLAAITLPVAHRAPQLGMIGAGTTSRS